MTVAAAIALQHLSHRYGDRVALDRLSFDVAGGEIFGLLGPNGGGKTTLFRILTTLLPVQSGTATLLGLNVAEEPAAVRRRIGITFQSPSLDDRLSVFENLKHQGHLYGLAGRDLRGRISVVLSQLGLADRARDMVAVLSGGLKRRVEIAKGLLHQPRILLLDEPSTGLDPGVRHDLWSLLRQIRDEQQVTILVTTHLMEEAERCDRLAILDAGRVVALGSPEELRRSVGGDCLTIHSPAPNQLADRIESEFHIRPHQIGSELRIEQSAAHELLRELVVAFPQEISSVSLGKPTLQDVFIARTGHRFSEAGESTR